MSLPATTLLEPAIIASGVAVVTLQLLRFGWWIYNVRSQMAHEKAETFDVKAHEVQGYSEQRVTYGPSRLTISVTTNRQLELLPD